MNPKELAIQWRVKRGYTSKGGVVVMKDGVVNGWVNKLCDPNHWIPGCIAIDESGNQWISVGGNEQDGAERWEPVPTLEFELHD